MLRAPVRPDRAASDSAAGLEFGHGLRLYAALGAIVGLSHALVETAALGWFGVALVAGDLALYSAVYALYGVLAGMTLWAALRAAAAVWGVPRGLDRRETAARWLWAPALAAYAALGSWWTWSGEGGGATVPWILVLCGSALWVCRRTWRDPHEVLAATCGWIAVCALGVGATLYAAEGSSVPAPKRLPLGLGFVALGAAAMLAMQALGRGRVPRRPIRPGVILGALTLGLVCEAAATAGPWPPRLGWLVLSADQQAEPDRTGRPDILLLVLDTVRADHMDLFGYERPTMPFVAQFARNEAAIAVASTAPGASSLESHGAMFTGMYPSSHGGHGPFVDDPDPPSFGYPIRADVPMLAETLSDLGYRTAGISGNYAVVGSFGLARGFRHHDAAPGRKFLARRIAWLNRPLHYRAAAGPILPWLPAAWTRRTVTFDPGRPPYRRADAIVDLATSWIDANPDPPFFLFLNLFDAHDPYLPPPEFDHRFVARPEGLSWTGFPDDELYRELVRGTARLSDDELRYLEGQYDAALVFVDSQVRRLFDHLRRVGRYEDTLIFVVSDHGEGFMEHGLLRHSTSLYEPQVSVPFLVKLPRTWSGPPPPVSPYVQHVDIFPTVMELLGEPVPASVQGVAWGAGRDHAFSEAFAHLAWHEPLRREAVAVVQDGWKYIRTSRGTEEWYDLTRDPDETTNLAPLDEERQAAALAILRRHLAATYRERPTTAAATSTLDRLRSLGYVE